MVDANSCYNPEQAIEIGKLLEDNNITHFEEPCPYWKPEQTKIVTDSFFDNVVVNDKNIDIKNNRLELLKMFCNTLNTFINFSKLEGIS